MRQASIKQNRDKDAIQGVTESRCYVFRNLHTLFLGIGSRCKLCDSECANSPVSEITTIRIIILPIDVVGNCIRRSCLQLVGHCGVRSGGGIKKVDRNRECSINATVRPM